jgi:ribose 1,5-bisphosphokinase
MKGRLFLIVGNSGSGKDSIIKGVKALLPALKVAKRFITREPDGFEDNHFVSFDNFNSLLKRGEFFLNWTSYGLNYGVSKEALDWLAEGHDVLINISRDIIDAAKKLYRNTKVVFVNAPLEQVINRIKLRGREDNKSVNERVNRAITNQDYSYADYVIDNSGDLNKAINQLRSILSS